MGTETKICTGCQHKKPLSEFFSRGGKLAHLYKSQCKSCMQAKRLEWGQQNCDHLNDWRRNNWVVTNRRLRRRGATQEMYNAMYEAQKGCCALCNGPEEKFTWLCIDHDHETGKIRGLLCPNCNRGLGLLKDSASLLQKAAEYITVNKPLEIKERA